MSRPPYRPFTPAYDEAILRLRAEKKTWRAIAEVTGQWHVSCQRRWEVLTRTGENHAGRSPPNEPGKFAHFDRAGACTTTPPQR